MTRYVIIALMNLLVVGAIAANALFALVRGCNMDGTCAGGSSMLTWGLGVGLGLVVLAGAALLIRRVMINRRSNGTQDIAIAAFARDASDGQGAMSEADGDEAMLSRLARMTRSNAENVEQIEPIEVAAAHTADTAVDRSTADDNWALNEAAHAVPAVYDDEGWEVEDEADDKGWTPPVVDPVVLSEPAPADLHVVVRDGERTEPRPYSFEIEDDEEDAEPENRFTWLFDNNAASNAAHLRRDTGFPWAVAGIDHVCQGVSRFGLLLAGTDIASEASAWCQVTASLPRGEALGQADSVAFTDWLNGSLRLIGRSGEAMIDEAMEALEAEAASDPALARCLPAAFWADGDSQDQRIARFG